MFKTRSYNLKIRNDKHSFPHKRQFFWAQDGQDYWADRLKLFMRYEWKLNWENRTSEIEVISDCFVIEDHTVFQWHYEEEFGLGSFFKDTFFIRYRHWLKTTPKFTFVLFKLPMELTLISNNCLHFVTVSAGYLWKAASQKFCAFLCCEERTEIQ